ncbi:MAG TPA: FadR/GntR family transcriptional regulator [Acidimicrobiales bacterium]|nr:FadR/GntR family transcriptional regulator [Acidimicrobiales bacterium]
MAVTDEAIEKIKEMIVSGVLQPGDRLPKEDELATALGLSRSSLREAVRALSLVRVLDVRQGDGTYVTSLRPELLMAAMSFVVDFHRDDSVLHFLEVRRMLEPAATAVAARRVSDGDVAELRVILDEVDPGAEPETFVANDRKFHSALVSHCGNPVLASLLDSISGPIQRARVWRGVTDPDAPQRTVREHHAIVDAVAAHEPDVAAARALVHIAGLEQWLRDARPF